MKNRRRAIFSDMIPSFSRLMPVFVAAITAFAACHKIEVVPAPDPEIKFEVPSNFPAPTYDFTNNPVTKAGFELGRRLFYDPMLSRDSTISCADCHIGYSAFSHPDHTVSHGIDGLFGKRNAIAMQNLAWRTSYFWDGGVPLLDIVPLNPIQNPVEMDESPVRIVAKLNRHPQYPDLFRQAFHLGPTDTVTGPQMLMAMSQFMCMMISADSRYDKYVRQEAGGELTDEELTGKALFEQKCAVCHPAPFFTDQGFRNNGIQSHFAVDKGRFEVSTFSDDIGKFAVPSLRNIEKTAPYMHNGKFKNLEEILEHYATGVKDSPTLDPLLRLPDGQLGIPMTATEQRQIIAFLKTLTDEAYIRDTRFQQPQ